jgi:HPt (histidine-containing phosphotransfer) domain-containing protein
LARLNGNARLYLKLLLRFREDFRDSAATLSQLVANDRPQAQALVHALKGVAGNLAGMALWQACQNLETAMATEGDSEGALAVLVQELQAALADLEQLQHPPADLAAPATPSEDSIEPLRAALTRLKEALEEGDAQAEELLQPWRASLVGHGCGDELAELERQLEDFALDEAATIVERLLEGLPEAEWADPQGPSEPCPEKRPGGG